MHCTESRCHPVHMGSNITASGVAAEEWACRKRVLQVVMTGPPDGQGIQGLLCGILLHTSQAGHSRLINAGQCNSRSKACRHCWCCVPKARCIAGQSCWPGKASLVPTVLGLRRVAASVSQQCSGSTPVVLLAQPSELSLTPWACPANAGCHKAKQRCRQRRTRCCPASGVLAQLFKPMTP